MKKNILLCIAIFCLLVCGCENASEKAINYIGVTKIRQGTFSQIIAQKEGIYYFRTHNDSLYMWENDSVTCLLDNFHGECLQVIDDKLMYTDAHQRGLYQYDLLTQQIDCLVDYNDLPDFTQDDYSTTWWQYKENFFLLNYKERTRDWSIWVTDQTGKYVETIEMPGGKCDISFIREDEIIYSTNLLLPYFETDIRDICVYNYITEETRTLLEYDEKLGTDADGNVFPLYGRPVGFRENKLIVPYLGDSDIKIYAVDLQTGDTEVVAETDAEIELIAVNDKATFLLYPCEEEDAPAPNKWLCSFKNGELIKIGLIDHLVPFAQLEQDKLFFQDVKNLKVDKYIDLSNQEEGEFTWNEIAACSDGTVYRLYLGPPM